MGSLEYDRSFFRERERGSLSSAREVVPYLVSLLDPASVLDVGCGGSRH
jgi:hypothetical protein